MFETIASFFASVLATLGLATAPATEIAPRRVVSLNLCADQYIMALADPGQITALTHNARDPEMSYRARRAQRFPISRGSAEEVLALEPDLIIASPYQRHDTLALLKGRDVTFLDLPPAESWSQIVDQVRQLAKALGHPDRGEALLRRMEAEMVAPIGAPAHRPVVAYYQRRGYMTGTGTLVDEMMQRTGLTNLAAKLGKPALARVSLEEMVAARPDYLIVESATEAVADQGTEMLHHAAIADIPRISLPQALTVCGGPSYPEAIRRLRDQLAARH